MPKSACCCLFLALFCTSCKPADETVDKPAVETPLVQKTKTQSYEEILYELGAFPVSKLTKPYWTNGHPGQVYSKGTRVDIHGWLPPFWVRGNSYLAASERKQYGIPKAPLRYERCVAIMDVETYQKTKDPLLFAIIKFTLDELHWRKIDIKNPEDILKVYHAKMGLDNLVLQTLRGQGLTGPMVADLYRQYQDPLLFHYLIPPEAGQDDYKTFLKQLLADQKIDTAHRFDVYTQLYQSDKKRYLTGYKKFIFNHVEQLPEWYHRCAMYKALANIGDEESIKAVNHALLNDPIANVRSSILYELTRQEKIVEYINTIHLLSLGKGKKYDGVFAPSGPRFQYGETLLTRPLREYLKWAKEKQNLKEETQRKIESALQALTIKRPQPKPGPGEGFEANDPQD